MRYVRTFVIAAAALAVPSPLSAQSAVSASTPDDDLKCAAWASVVIGINKDKPDVVSHLTSALTWFLGRYEAATGKTFEQGLTPEYYDRIGPDLEKIEPGCKDRIARLGSRMTDWGQFLQARGKAAAQNPSGH